MFYKNKEDGTFQQLSDIKREYAELLANTSQFNEYIDNFEKFLVDYYEVESNE